MCVFAYEIIDRISPIPFRFFCFYFLFCFFAVRFTYLKNWVCWRHRLVADAGMDGREGLLLTEKGKWGP